MRDRRLSMIPAATARVIAAVVVLGASAAGCSSTVTGSGTGGPTASGTSAGRSSAPVGPSSTTPPATSGSPQPVKGDAQLQAPDHDFAISLPSGWIDSPTRARDAGAYVVYLEAAKQNFSANVNVVREDVPAGTRIATIQPQLLASVRTLHLTKLSKVTHRTLDGDDAITYVFERVAEGDLHLRQMQVATVHDAQEYVVTYTDTVAEFQHDYAEALALIDSWHWV